MDSSAGVEVKKSMQLKRKNIKKGKTRRCIGFLFVHKQVFEEENKRERGFVLEEAHKQQMYMHGEEIQRHFGAMRRRNNFSYAFSFSSRMCFFSFYFGLRSTMLCLCA